MRLYPRLRFALFSPLLSSSHFHVHEAKLLVSEVYKARAKKDNALVALKKILMHHEKEGVGTISAFLKEASFYSIAD